ncbi:porin [Caballeronia novacaledonica]|uniref:Porin n=1 Tax=Caballeronia novacaledonica TaxID=1544861 RepID=A0A2U3I3G9_9BURK|nr:porin [Caballeronia novacaledonica]SPB14609.1 porin [Caballeronia novacaledonica]
MRFMKHGICGAALFVAAGSAAAQSSVTLYGTVDVFAQYLSGGGTHSFSERSGGSSASAFGLRGSEDLGDGLRAIFTLENGFTTNNGGFFADSTTMFYRQAWVGLNDARYGALTFGRQYQPSFYAIYPTEPFFANELLSPLAAALLAFDRSTLATQFATGRSSNSVMYQSPNLYGAKLYAMYALSGSTNVPLPGTTGNMLNVGLNYTIGDLYVGLGYKYQHGSQTTALAPVPVSLPGTTQYVAGLAYHIGIVELMANYTYTQPGTAPTGSPVAVAGLAHSFSVIEAGANIQASAADMIELAFIERAVRSPQNDNALGFQFGYDHNLSKRTSVYLRAGFIKNNGSSTMSWVGNTVSQTGTKQILGVLGMTHRF